MSDQKKCVRCKKNDAAPGKTYCEECLEKRRKQAKERYKKKKNRRFANGEIRVKV